MVCRLVVPIGACMAKLVYALLPSRLSVFSNVYSYVGRQVPISFRRESVGQSNGDERQDLPTYTTYRVQCCSVGTYVRHAERQNKRN
ncbi:hypothetical protein GGS21DRAFT_509673 [Xylaria nigripes]|nr:hypothetical protein GGS21DRAFT_509673 [Xylaria nigripes]